MVAIRDKEIQRNGIVFVLWSVGNTQFAANRPGKLTALWSIFPIRIVAVHICYDNPLLNLGFQLIQKTMETKFLIRCRGHFGTYLECIYELSKCFF